ncbi:MAG TPA: archease [Armatimonadota bacterium]|nr:archease [Armatimonadota bacterium]
MRPFEEVDHTADLALLARGKDLPELILNACRGVIHLISDTDGLAPDVWVEISASSDEPERVLVRFVKQLLLEWEINEGLPVAVELSSSSGEGITGRVGFAHPNDDDIDRRIKGIPKAATYHDLATTQVGDHLEVTLVLDV